MSLGLGIFLSTLVVAVLLLCRWYGERWKMGRKLKIIATVVVVLLAVGYGGLWGWSYWEGRPKPQTGYYGVNLGMRMNEVVYVLGSPTTVDEPPDKDTRWAKVDKVEELAKDKTIQDFFAWSYGDTDGDENKARIDVEFSLKTKKVTSIGCYSSGQYCHSVNGITVGTTEDEVTEKLGKPTAVMLNEATKTLRYDELHMEISLTKKAVYMIKVVDPVIYQERP
jgi:hypothetical protein